MCLEVSFYESSKQNSSSLELSPVLDNSFSFFVMARNILLIKFPSFSVLPGSRLLNLVNSQLLFLKTLLMKMFSHSIVRIHCGGILLTPSFSPVSLVNKCHLFFTQFLTRFSLLLLALQSRVGFYD